MLVLVNSERATRERRGKASSVIYKREEREPDVASRAALFYTCVRARNCFLRYRILFFGSCGRKKRGSAGKAVQAFVFKNREIKEWMGRNQSSQKTMNIKNYIDRISCTIQY